MRVGAELLDHDDLGVDRRQLGRRERGVLERLRTDAENDVDRPTLGLRPASSGTRNWPRTTSPPSIVASTRFIAGEPMNPATNRSPGLLVEHLRGVHLKDVTVPHDRHALAQRHRFHLVVRDVDGRDAELLMELRERRAHADA